MLLIYLVPLKKLLGKGITINGHIYEVIGVIDENSIRNNAEKIM